MPGRGLDPNLKLEMLLSVFRVTDFDSALANSELNESGRALIQKAAKLVEVGDMG